MDTKTTYNSITELMKRGVWACVELLASFNRFQQGLPEGEQMCYPNQEEMGKALSTGIFATGVFFQIVVALTQSGKTGCMSALIKHCIESAENIITPENIFVITGISSKDWVIQTRGRMPDMIEKQIVHRNDLKKLAKILKGRENVLIIVDEVHIACGKKMSINKLMLELGYKDPEFLMENNINFVEFSATPGAVLKDHNLEKFGWKLSYQPKLVTLFGLSAVVSLRGFLEKTCIFHKKHHSCFESGLLVKIKLINTLQLCIRK